VARERFERREVVRVLDRGDQLAILHHDRHALELERLRRLQQLARRRLRALEHRAGRDRNAELEAEIDGERFEIDQAHLEQHGAEPAAVFGLCREGGFELRVG
jgi:hypothetical protein